MRGAATAALIWAVGVAAGCAGPKAVGARAGQATAGPEAKAAPAPAPAVGGSGALEAPVDPKTAAKDKGEVFVDRENGFTIMRPGEGWRFRAGEALSTDNIVVPLVMMDESTGAQVVVQVAPAVASPAQFAERLTSGLQSRQGFSTGEVAPIPLAEGAVGFDFRVGDQVHGRVAILEGSAGRVYVLLATWPEGSPRAVEVDVETILGSMKTSEP